MPGPLKKAIRGAFPSDFTLTVTYTATDLCGNTTVQTATLTVLDTVAPVMTDLPADTTLDCAAWPDYLAPVPGATDNCTSDLGDPAVDTVVTPGACDGQFTVAITTTYTTWPATPLPHPGHRGHGHHGTRIHLFPVRSR